MQVATLTAVGRQPFGRALNSVAFGIDGVFAQPAKRRCAPHLGHPPCFSIQLTGRKARAGPPPGGLWRSMVGPFSGPPTNQCKWSMVGANAAYVKRRLPSP